MVARGFYIPVIRGFRRAFYPGALERRGLESGPPLWVGEPVALQSRNRHEVQGGCPKKGSELRRVGKIPPEQHRRSGFGPTNESKCLHLPSVASAGLVPVMAEEGVRFTTTEGEKSMKQRSRSPTEHNHPDTLYSRPHFHHINKSFAGQNDPA